MTKLSNKPPRTFMGMNIVGEGYPSTRAEQLPIEDLYPYFTEAFAKGVTAVTWQHYTPGWNDGEPCEFTVTEPAYTSNPEVTRAWLSGSQDVDLEEAYGPQAGYYDRDDYTYYGKHPDGLELNKIRIPVDTEQFEDALLATFGNYTEIVVTPETVVQFEYDCGY